MGGVKIYTSAEVSLITMENKRIFLLTQISRKSGFLHVTYSARMSKYENLMIAQAYVIWLKYCQLVK